MPDCTGYGFGVDITLCVNGPVGNGNRADLTITLNNTVRDNFTETPVVRFNWDGRRLEVPLSLSSGFNTADCTTREAKLTIIPDSGVNTGTLLLEFTLDDCSAAGGPSLPQVFENCGGAGPHVISEMSTYTLDQDATCVGD